jgi:hypothetical protein
MTRVRSFLGCRQLLAGVSTAVVVAGCGGGVWIGFGDDFDDLNPSVSVATAAASVVAGGTLRVVAAAADDDGIDEVAFYRRDGTRWTRLGADASEPYEWAVSVPADGRTEVMVFARATDRSGRQADSDVLSVPVVP